MHPSSTALADLPPGLFAYCPFLDGLASVVGTQLSVMCNEPSYAGSWRKHPALRLPQSGIVGFYMPDRLADAMGNNRGLFGLGVWFCIDEGQGTGPLSTLFSDASGWTIKVSAQEVQVSYRQTPLLGWAHGFDAGRWSHVFVSADTDGQARLWINGAIADTKPLPGGTPQAPFIEGSAQAAAGQAVDIHGMAFFNAPTTAATIIGLASNLFHPGFIAVSSIDYVSFSTACNAPIPVADDPGFDFGSTGSPFTITARVSTKHLDADDAKAQLLFVRENAYGMEITADGQLHGWVKLSAGGQVELLSPDWIGDSPFPHLAMSCVPYSSSGGGEGALLLFVDGNLVAQETFRSAISAVPSPSPLTAGGAQTWSSIRSVALYSEAFAEDTISQAMRDGSAAYQEGGDNTLLGTCVAFYDFSTTPPRSWPTPARKPDPTLPPTVQAAIETRGVTLNSLAYVDCGISPAHNVTPTTAFTFEVWVYLQSAGGRQVIASRALNSRGYTLAVNNCFLEVTFQFGASAPPLSIQSQAVIPQGEWIQVGFTVAIAANALTAQLFVNGCATSGSYNFSAAVPQEWTLAPADIPLTLGVEMIPEDPANWSGAYFIQPNDTLGLIALKYATTVDALAQVNNIVNKDIIIQGTTLIVPAPTPTNSLNGLVERVRIHDGVIDPYLLYFAKPPQPHRLLGDWLFDFEETGDLTHAHPSLFCGGAQTQTLQFLSAPAGAMHALRTASARADVLADSFFSQDDNLHGSLSPAQQAAIKTTSSLAGAWHVHAVGDVSILALHADLGEQPHVVSVTSAMDSSNDWMNVVILVMPIAMRVFGLKLKSPKKLGTVVGNMWKAQPVRNALKTLLRSNAASLPNNLFSAFKAIYAEGFFSKLFWCFDVGFFTIVRLASYFVPWAGIASFLATLGQVAVDLINELTRNGDKLQVEPNGLHATCAKARDAEGRISVTVNGSVKGVLVTISLARPPSGNVNVNVTSEAAAIQVTPSSFTLTAGAMSAQVFVRAETADSIEVLRDTPVDIFFEPTSTTDAVAPTAIKFKMVVADLVFIENPTTFQLTETGEYVGSFEVTFSEEIDEASTPSVTLLVENPEDREALTFDPTVINFLPTDDVGDPTPRKKVKGTIDPAKLKRKGATIFPAKGTTTVPRNRAANGSTMQLRIRRAPLQDNMVLKMVQAKWGNSFVLSDIARDRNKEISGILVIDGGPSGTYASALSAALPPDHSTPINNVICTHYDDDHICGLIEMLQDPTRTVRQVIFNRPRAALETSPPPTFETLGSVANGVLFANLASRVPNRLVGVTSTFPAGTVPNGNLPAYEVKYLGPNVLNATAPLLPYWGPAINRQSIMNMVSRVEIDTGMLFTGDGYDTFDKPDVRTAHVPRPVLFLQVPHHGSRFNTDRAFYQCFPARHYLISSQRKFGHPHRECLEQIIAANAATGNTGYTIWLTRTDPLTPRQLSGIPNGPAFRIRQLNPGVASMPFTIMNGVIVATPEALTVDVFTRQ